MTLSLPQLIEICQERTQSVCSTYLENSSPAPLLQKAMAYAVLNGGKRIRPLLVYATGHTLQSSFEDLDAPAAAVELIHAYSLIHDDLPAMDNADLRRGKPACHKAFNEAIAILAGDGLQSLAFEILASHPSNLSAEQRLQMFYTLSKASGHQGMAGGQTLDMTGNHTLGSLTQMYQLKTGALLTASVTLGLLSASPQKKAVSLERYAECLGLAFQVQDDLLDVESNTALIGKPSGIDSTNQKITYPVLLGIEKTHTIVKELIATALESIAFLGKKGYLLREVAEYLLQRVA